jgi:hypothetical protein
MALEVSLQIQYQNETPEGALGISIRNIRESKDRDL